MIKKSKFEKLHAQEAEKIVKNNFCNMCSSHEGFCRRDVERCFAAQMVMKKIKKIFDKYD